jgi:predicted type IV restriction endonuclease
MNFTRGVRYGIIKHGPGVLNRKRFEAGSKHKGKVWVWKTAELKGKKEDRASVCLRILFFA